MDYTPSTSSLGEQELLFTLLFLSWKEDRKVTSDRLLLPERHIPICRNVECHLSDHEKKGQESNANLVSSMLSHPFLRNQLQIFASHTFQTGTSKENLILNGLVFKHFK